MKVACGVRLRSHGTLNQSTSSVPGHLLFCNEKSDRPARERERDEACRSLSPMAGLDLITDVSKQSGRIGKRTQMDLQPVHAEPSGAR